MYRLKFSCGHNNAVADAIGDKCPSCGTTEVYAAQLSLLERPRPLRICSDHGFENVDKQRRDL